MEKLLMSFGREGGEEIFSLLFIPPGEKKGGRQTGEGKRGVFAVFGGGRI